MSTRFLRSALAAVLAVLSCVGSWAADHQSVGLVLSGGGAKGIAHIGVIQALEDNDIPIDYIAGTSMGAIVGGLYAAGYTPDEMMRLITSKEFAYWSTGQINEKLLYNFFRDNPSPAMITIPINPNDSTKASSILPTSMISPLPMNFAFMELFAAYTGQCDGDFNNLFVPFRCVASDVYAKHKLVLSGGDFGDAIRASMTFPTVFQPIELDSVLVYDGGIYDNFPVDVMRQTFAPSIMIGSDVSNPEGKPKAGDLIDQLEDMIMQKSDYNIPPDEGIKIKCDLSKYSLLDFAKARQIYQVGYDRAMDMIDSIKGRVTARIPAESRNLRRRVFKSKTPYVRFDSVCVTGGSHAQNDYLEYLFTKNRTDTFGIAQAKLAYYQAITSGNLRNLVPHAVYDDSTHLYTLDMKADPKTNMRVSFGGYLTSSTNSMIYLSMGYNTLSFRGVQTNISGWIGQSYMAGALQGRLYLPTHLPSALEIQGVISRHKFYDSDNLFYEDKLPTFIIDNEAFGRLNYAWAAGRNATARFGVGGGRIKMSFYENNLTSYYDTGRDDSHYDLGQIRAAYEYNTLDNQQFPTAGAQYQAVATGVLGRYFYNPYSASIPSQMSDVKWMQALLRAYNFFGCGKHFAFGNEVEGLLSTRPLADNFNAAIVNAPSYRPVASTYNSFNPKFRANSYVAAGIIPVWMPFDRFQIRGNFVAFIPYKDIVEGENMRAIYGKPFHDPRFFGQLAAVYNFPFNASLSLYGNYYSSREDSWNFGISFGAFFLAPKFLR